MNKWGLAAELALSTIGLSTLVFASLSQALMNRVTFVGTLLLTFVQGGWYIAVIALVAFSFGGPCATNAAISTDFFGTKYSGSIYGVMMLALGVSSISFNWIANTLLRGAVIPTFLMAAGSATVAVGLMVVVGRFGKSTELAEE